jgi:hypothetical protein
MLLLAYIFVANCRLTFPAVYDVFAVAIKETARFPATAKMWVEAGVGMK